MFNRWKDILYDLIGQLARRGGTVQRSQRVLVVRLDEIGDYMLWRPVMRHLLATEAFASSEWTLCGNTSWRSLYEQLDGGSFQQVIWIDKLRFKKELRYRYRVLRDIHLAGYEVVINPTYSRDKRNDDAVVLAAAGKEVYGMVANLENCRKYERGYDEGMYNHLFCGPEEVLFELDRNRLFAAYVVGKTIEKSDWQIRDEQLPTLSVALPQKYMVIFPGSRSAKRIWPAAYFARVAAHCREQFGWEIVLCGGPADAVYAAAFKAAFTGEVIDLIGVTRLPELLTILRGAEWLVTVDTGSVHLGAAVGCRVTGIFNGSQYGRFSPYPKELTEKVHSVYPLSIIPDLQQSEVIRSQYLYTVDIPYESVQPEQVINTIKIIQDA
ncbi:MAG: glycosyltransferase family 9 protein [Bacteroidota bacterium]